MDKQELTFKEAEELIVAYLIGSIDQNDIKRLHDWINSGKENRQYFNQLKDAWFLSAGSDIISDEFAGASWNRFRYKLAKDERSGMTLSNVVKRDGRDKLLKYLKLAASWILLIGIGSAITLWWNNKKPDSGQNTASAGKVEILTPLGSKSFIVMPDSTRIWLNAGTQITYDNSYGTGTRTLDLVGEAFFDVAKDSLHPFIVNTQGITVRALGTRFNIKAYRNEKTISATLEEGRIAVRISGKSDKADVMLNPRDKLIFHKENLETEKYVESSEEKMIPEKNKPATPKDIKILSDVRTELYTSWKDSRWVIDGEPLSTLAPMLERRFNLRIVFEDEQLKKYRFTGTIENETVDQLLNALKLTAPIDYKIEKDTLRLILNNRSSEEFKKVMTH
jgi:ferric-dicitrate binding protein FerR (iron transport regulator)